MTPSIDVRLLVLCFGNFIIGGDEFVSDVFRAGGGHGCRRRGPCRRAGPFAYSALAFISVPLFVASIVVSLLAERKRGSSRDSI